MAELEASLTKSSFQDRANWRPKVPRMFDFVVGFLLPILIKYDRWKADKQAPFSIT